MLNLELKIVEWRRQMSAGGVNNPAVLDELESHVREDVERQMRSGVDPQKAFEAAVQKIGPASALKNEFKKSRASVMRERLMIAAAVFVVTFGIFLSVAAAFLCYLSLAERLVGLIGMTSSVAAACAWPALVSRLPAIRSKRKLQLAQVLCLAAGFGLCTLYIQLIVNRLAYSDGMIPAVGFFGIFFIALGFGVAAGLDRAASRPGAELEA
jgi:hypothetical protein